MGNSVPNFNPSEAISDPSWIRRLELRTRKGARYESFRRSWPVEAAGFHPLVIPPRLYHLLGCAASYPCTGVCLYDSW
ncbi:hypothetical protein CONPUDRAFT_87192 [Coniophora puteana RWD-64-598 SS2]|uniref:Uncharacterized protein n=1 Tax=Coniophora puteana (strain RWD-64-598) TaxID=741705 RepID=A0A5M3N7G9_CONPW|nr:uncharacterized protein CONPUDRAFT_87192 [Coniophora puteana RWD-64-598 SS2]EIW87400.1 hypothetical protein CONPUDRAFT_87192 [Coniophora puteana RWD-64-598 SS2]